MTDPTDQLRAGLKTLGIADSERLTDRLVEFATILLAANEHTNLVGAHDLDELIAAHFLDSLAPLAGKPIAWPLIDVGSGAGLPAIPVAMVHPAAEILMLEPRAKRIGFLGMATERLGLQRVKAEKMTAETAGRRQHRGSAATVTIRAVAPAPTSLELGLPLLKVGGKLLLYAGRQAYPSEHELEVADVLGGALLEAYEVAVPYLTAVRHAWWFEKKKETPEAYPRRAKLPSKHPL